MTKEVFERLLNEKQYKAIKSIFDTLNPVDTAALLPEFDEKEMVILFRLIPKENAALVFTYLDAEEEQVLVDAITDSELRAIMNDMFIDDTVDVIEEMPANVVERILQCTSQDKRRAINSVLNYPEDSAGSIMTLEFVSLQKEFTVAEALKKIKQTGIHKETIYTCYVIEKHKLLGIVSAKDLLTCDDDEKIEDIMETNIISVHTHTDKEEVANLFNKYDLISLPVTDNENCLVGIVTFDDAIDVIQEEAEEDFSKMAGMTPADKPYLKTSAFQLWKMRIPWLLVLMISATFTGIIISSFETALSKIVALTAFIPMIMGTGGNSGSQASVAIIRGISLGEIEFKDIFKVIWKECRVSVLCGISLGIAGFGKVMLIDYLIMHTVGTSVTSALWIALVVGITLAFTVICAKFIGCTLPILAGKIGLDPAVMASPLITTVMDSVSLLIYFAAASSILHL